MTASMRLETAVEFFLRDWPTEGAAPGSVRSVAAALRWFVPFAAERDVHHVLELTPSVLRAAAASKMDAGQADRPLNWKGGEAAAAILVWACRTMTTWLARQGLPVNDLSAVRAPRVPERVQPRLTFAEFARLERAVLERLVATSRRQSRLLVARDLALLHLLGETGLRANEVCRLTTRDVDLVEGLVTVRRGKGRKDRVLSIVGTSDDPDAMRVVQLLATWIEARQTLRNAASHTWLWTSLKGGPLTTHELRRILGRLCMEAGLDGNRSPHAFRRFQFTERYREQPTALPRLSARMGWSTKSHKMADVYTRGVELEMGRDRIELLGSRLRPTAERPPSRTLDAEARRLLEALHRNPELLRVVQDAIGGAA